MTRQLLAQRDAAALEQADKRMLYSIIREILSNLQDALPVVFTVRMQEDLGKVVRSSMELAQLLHHQAAKFRVGMIRARSTDGRPTPFDSNQMEDVSGAMEGGDQGWEVQMTVFPGVFKWGDERGENVRLSRRIELLIHRLTCLKPGRGHEGCIAGEGRGKEERGYRAWQGLCSNPCRRLSSAYLFGDHHTAIIPCVTSDKKGSGSMLTWVARRNAPESSVTEPFPPNRRFLIF